jgi:BolA family transcriptional regulator, general stress-responsive regulator
MTDMPSEHSRPSRTDRLRMLLSAKLPAQHVEVVDDSARHLGHAGARPEGETHYTVLVVSSRFEGMTRLARSRLVHEILAQEFAGGMHALSLVLRSPTEHCLT